MKPFSNRHCERGEAIQFHNLSSLRANIVSAAIHPCNTACEWSGLLRRLRLLAMTILINLVPTLAMACSGPVYDPNVPRLSAAEELMNALWMMLKSNGGQAIFLLFCLGGFYWSVRMKKEPWYKVVIITVGFPASILTAMLIIPLISIFAMGAIVSLAVLFSVLLGMLWLWRKKIIWWKALLPLAAFLFLLLRATLLC